MKKFVCILMALLSVAVVFACSREPEYKNPISKEQLSEFLREKQYISTSPITFKFSLNYDSTTYEDLRSEDNLATKKILTKLSVSGQYAYVNGTDGGDRRYKYNGKLQVSTTSPSITGFAKESGTQRESTVCIGNDFYLAYKYSQNDNGGDKSGSGKTTAYAKSVIYPFLNRFMFAIPREEVFDFSKNPSSSLNDGVSMFITSEMPIEHCLRTYETDDCFFDYVFAQNNSLILMQSNSVFERTRTYVFSGNNLSAIKVNYKSAEENYELTIKYTESIPDIQPPKTPYTD